MKHIKYMKEKETVTLHLQSVSIAHTSSIGLGITISPAILRELADVRSIRTATNSHDSSSCSESFPPNHQTFNEVEVPTGAFCIIDETGSCME